MKKQKKILIRIIITLVIFFGLLICMSKGIFNGINMFMVLGIYFIPYILIGYDIIYKAFRNIRNGQVFDENFLMVIATFGAFAVNEYIEAVAVMLFYQIGELFQSYAVGKSRESIKDLMEICPEYANIMENEELIKVDPDDVEVGSIIVVKPGEKIPIDGVVLEGETMLNTMALTGESVPKRVRVDDEVISGCINESGLIKVKTTKEFEDSTVSKILELVESASNSKAKVENFITRFAKYYTPVVTIAAVICAIIPPLVLRTGFKEWIETACTFLVISCPCALVISVPLGFFGGIGAASKRGILVKGSNYLEAAAHMKTVVVDKTGTLTKGEFAVTKIVADETFNGKNEDILEIAAVIERYSNHPIAISIKDAYYNEIINDETNIQSSDTFNKINVSEVTEIPGYGISALVNGKEAHVGNDKLLKQHNIEYKHSEEIGTNVYVALDGICLGCITISDVIKKEAFNGISYMKKVGVKKIVMLTGDNKEVADYVTKQLQIDKNYSELLPADKVTKVEELLDELSNNERLAFVGDGINDAPVLTRADVGIAMGRMGSDAAIEAADIVIMDDDIGKISETILIARKTVSIVKQNIVFALGVKFLILIMSIFHIVGMWGGVFADVGVAVIAILNSMRMIYGKKDNKKYNNI